MSSSRKRIMLYLDLSLQEDREVFHFLKPYLRRKKANDIVKDVLRWWIAKHGVGESVGGRGAAVPAERSLSSQESASSSGRWSSVGGDVSTAGERRVDSPGEAVAAKVPSVDEPGAGCSLGADATSVAVVSTGRRPRLGRLM